jgi:hypothetical protein
LNGIVNILRYRNWLEVIFGKVKLIPNNLKPKYVSRIFLKIYDAIVEAILKLMKPLGSNKDPFIRQLALGCV